MSKKLTADEAAKAIIAERRAGNTEPIALGALAPGVTLAAIDLLVRKAGFGGETKLVEKKGKAKKSSSAEADAFQLETTGEASVTDGMSLGARARLVANGGAPPTDMPQSFDANDINAVKSFIKGGDPEPIAKLRVLINQEGLDPAIKERAGLVLTRHDLQRHAELTGLFKDSALVAELQSGDGGKGVAGAVDAAQSHAVAANFATIADGAGGTSGGAGGSRSGDPRAQVGSIGSGHGLPASLGTPQNVGTSKPGYITGREHLGGGPAAHPGSTGGEGAQGELAKAEAELEQVQKETKRGSITDREVDLRNRITHLRLAISHGAR